MDLFDKAKEALKTVADKSGDVAEKVKDKAEDVVGDIKDSELGKKAVDAAGDLKDKAGDAMHSAVVKAEEVTKMDLNRDGAVGEKAETPAE